MGAKRGLVVAKKLVVDDFWLVVSGGWASCNYRGFTITIATSRSIFHLCVVIQ